MSICFWEDRFVVGENVLDSRSSSVIYFHHETVVDRNCWVGDICGT